MPTIQDWFIASVQEERTVRSFYFDGRLIHVTNQYDRGLRGRVNSCAITADGFDVFWDNARSRSTIPFTTEVTFHGDVIRSVDYVRELRSNQIRLRQQRILQHMGGREAVKVFAKERQPFSLLDTKIVSDVQEHNISLDASSRADAYLVTYLNGWAPTVISDVRGFAQMGPYLFVTGKREAARLELQV